MKMRSHNLRSLLLTTAISSIMFGMHNASVHAGEFYTLDNFPTSLQFSGKIELGDDTKLDAAIAQRFASGLITEYLVLDSGGGMLYPAYLMAYKIRNSNITTIVPSDGTCASACMLMFAAGTKRVVWRGARLGVHAASEGMNADGRTKESGDGTVSLARDMAKFGTPDTVIALMVVTPPESMTWLQPKDVGDWVYTPSDAEHQQSEAQRLGQPTQQTQQPSPPVAQPTQPQQTQPQQTVQAPTYATPSNASVTMSCTNPEIGDYSVSWSAEGMWIKGTFTYVTESHQHSGTGAYVVTGPTRYGTYGAVFGGPNPRIEYSNGKEVVKDSCWL